MPREENHMPQTARAGVSSCSFTPVLSHPDYDRRLRNYTESADPDICQALAGFGHSARYRRWGITPRPENWIKI